MSPTTATDWALLEFLAAHPQPIRDLLGAHPKATVYARLRALQAKGLVAKRGSQYLLTTAGLQAKSQHASVPALDGLDSVYAPLRKVPSPQHRALIELAIGALVLRQLTDQEEHHAGFLLVGPPMTWKTEGGRFVCHLAGADPAACVVDLASESGRSLWVRRGAAGDIRSQRALLSAPVIVLDEYGLADRAVRQAVVPFLSGRRRLPVENEILPITPVPIITMNPGLGNTLTTRTGFSLAQLRRLVPCDLGAMSLPDLALEGGQAIDAVRQAGVLTLRAPKRSCEEFRGAVVRLLRHVLVPEAVGLVDVELLLGLGRGLTGWLTPVVAMRQVLYDFLLVVETVRWVRSEWLEAARAFLDNGQDEALSPHGTRGSVAQTAASAPPPHTISLFPDQVAPARQKEHPGMNPRDSMLPTFAISDRTKALMVWLAEDAGVSLDQVVHVLVDDYRMRQGDGLDFEDLLAVVRLREACETAEIAVGDLRIAVELTAGLRERGLTVDHIQTTLQVAEDLAESGLSLKEALAVAGLMKAMRKAGVDPRLPEYLGATLQRYGVLGYDPKQITRLAEFWERLRGLGLGLDELEPVLARLSRLTVLGLDVETAEALATGLDLAGIPEALRGDVLAKAVELGQAGVALADVQADRDARQEEVQRLRNEQAAIQDALTVDQDELSRTQQEQADGQTALAALREKAALYEDAITAGLALQDFLLGSLDAADMFFTRVVAIREIRRKGSAQFPGIETTLTEAIQRGVREFLARISTLPLPPPPPPGAQGTATKG
jgi:hypothetical protein